MNPYQIKLAMMIYSTLISSQMKESMLLLVSLSTGLDSCLVKCKSRGLGSVCSGGETPSISVLVTSSLSDQSTGKQLGPEIEYIGPFPGFLQQPTIENSKFKDA